MSTQFDVSVQSLKEVFEIPGFWGPNEYSQLMEALELDDLGDVQDDEVLEMVLMALQDLEPEEAADAVLEVQLQERVTRGVRDNITQDLLDDEDGRPWEDYADFRLHSRIFAASSLLYKAIPSKFPKPEMLQLTLRVKGKGPEASTFLSGQPDPEFVVRLIAAGLDDRSILHRLFEEQLASETFPEAEGIVWRAEFIETTGGETPTAALLIHSSNHWLKDMKEVEDFQATFDTETD